MSWLCSVQRDGILRWRQESAAAWQGGGLILAGSVACRPLRCWLANRALACEAAPTSDFDVSRRVRVKFRCLTCDCFWFEGNSTTSPCMARQNSSSSPRARELLVAAGRPPAPSASRGRRRRGHALETTVVDALTNCHPQTTADVGKPATKPRRWAGTRTIAAAQKAHH